MPRQPIPIPHRVESLSVLDANGNLDRELEPEISEDDLRRLYKYLVSARMLDERCFKMQRQGRIGTYAPTRGQEAASLGIAYVLTPDDWMVPSFRESAAMLWRGWSMERMFLYWGGHELGTTPPEGVNDTPIAVPVASQCSYGPGIAWGLKLRRQGRICAAFVGDGGTSEGDFHEGMNFAGVYQLPYIQVVQNNHWAISLPRYKQTASPTIAQKAIAYGFDAIQVDGNDLLAVIVAMREAAEKARTGGGPTLIEAVTYRLGVHTTADDPKKYRDEKEVEEWLPRDPIPRFRKYLHTKGVLNDQQDQAILDEIKAELDAATKSYEEYKVDPLGFFHHMYSEMTPELIAQKAELEAYLSGHEPAQDKTERYSRVL
ncbi:MAG: pyruvate dehydrogenase (acetyl-transferring) E1 component subunit alpha [Phycisphaerae bacterium]|nr:pyruvate dehydrogenase (acetyl-transferring) E1 component subunit alpha [Phycisphaerae bacterium]